MATITPVVGNIGQKTDRNNLLTYSLTGTMSTITEKVNGVTIGTKTAASGQSLTVGLTQVQWDAVAYGAYNKYRNLILPFTDSAWVKHANATAKNDYTLELIATGTYQNSYILVNVQPGLTYFIKATYANSIIEIQRPDTSAILKQLLNGASGSFTVPSGVTKIKILMLNGNTTSGTFTFSNPLLIEGSTDKPFVPYGSNNTIAIEMGAETFTYTFAKRLATDADLLSAVKASKDANEVYLPAVKSKLVSKVGGNVVETFETIIDGISAKKFASGTTSYSSANLVISGLSFSPSKVLIYANDGLTSVRKYLVTTVNFTKLIPQYSTGAVNNTVSVLDNGTAQGSIGNSVRNADGASIPSAFLAGAGNYYWEADE